MKSYPEKVSAHRRLTILKWLSDSDGYTSNASILEDVCNEFGIPSSRDQITGEIEWLKSVGFVSSKSEGGFVVATATVLGVRIAEGKARHEGVQRPRPGE